MNDQGHMQVICHACKSIFVPDFPEYGEGDPTPSRLCPSIVDYLSKPLPTPARVLDSDPGVDIVDSLSRMHLSKSSSSSKKKGEDLWIRKDYNVKCWSAQSDEGV